MAEGELIRIVRSSVVINCSTHVAALLDTLLQVPIVKVVFNSHLATFFRDMKIPPVGYWHTPYIVQSRSTNFAQMLVVNYQSWIFQIIILAMTDSELYFSSSWLS